MKNKLKLSFITSIYCFTITYLYAHKDHSSKPKMPAIGVIQGTIVDSISSSPLEYASVSLVELEHNELITGGLTDKNGYLNITEIPLGRYVAVVEFIGYEKKEIDDTTVSTLCIDGYKFVITSSNNGESIVQVFKSRGGKLSYPERC